MIDNIVIGKILVEPHLLFAKDENDWEKNIKARTHFTEERFLPRLLVEVGAVKSVSEVRRNQPKLMVTLDEIDFITVKWGKRILSIAIGQ